jgi:hybrid polyketide synthase/nonribosomal peptide synthetase ACE1
MELRSDEIGVDSLIAVEMRSWFLQNYEANIPVLSILGGVSLADLVNQAVREMPEHLTPNIVSDKEDGMPLETNRSPTSSESESSTAESISVDGSTSYTSSSHSGELDVTTPLPDIIEKPAVVVERSTSLSFTQSMFWFVHTLIQDKTTLNHTVSLLRRQQPACYAGCFGDWHT